MDFENRIQNQLKERENAITDIVNKLCSQEFAQEEISESIGGNAGENRVAVRAWVDKKTGRITKFGAIQYVKKEITSNPNFGEVIFIFNVGRWHVVRSDSEEKFVVDKEGYFEDVIAASDSNVSETAIGNLREAIRRFNKISSISS